MGSYAYITDYNIQRPLTQIFTKKASSHFLKGMSYTGNNMMT